MTATQARWIIVAIVVITLAAGLAVGVLLSGTVTGMLFGGFVGAGVVWVLTQGLAAWGVSHLGNRK